MTGSLDVKMKLANDGDKKAYADVLSESTLLLRGFISKKINNFDDVEDVVQEILISLHNSRHTYDGTRPFKPWLFAIAKFRLYDYLRKIYKKAENECELEQENLENFSEDVTEHVGEYEELYEEIEKLPKTQRSIIELMKIEGYTAKEVAIKLQMSESAVKVSAHRTYKKLKEKLENVR